MAKFFFASIGLFAISATVGSFERKALKLKQGLEDQDKKSKNMSTSQQNASEIKALKGIGWGTALAGFACLFGSILGFLSQ